MHDRLPRLRWFVPFGVACLLLGAGVSRVTAQQERSSLSGRARDNLYFTAAPDQTTSSTAFREIGLGPLLVARGVVTADVSITTSGGPVEIRMTSHSTPMSPGVASFDSTSGPTSGSYTFAIGRRGEGCYQPTVEWRSPTGAEITLHHAALHLIANEPENPRI